MFVMPALQLPSSVGEESQFQKVKTKALHANPRCFSVPCAVLQVGASPSLFLGLCQQIPLRMWPKMQRRCNLVHDW